MLDVMVERVGTHGQWIRVFAAEGDPRFGRLLAAAVVDDLDRALVKLDESCADYR